MEYPGKPKTCPCFKQLSGDSFVFFFFSVEDILVLYKLKEKVPSLLQFQCDARPGSLHWFCLVCGIPGKAYILNLKPGRSLSKGLWPSLSAAQSPRVSVKLHAGAQVTPKTTYAKNGK